MAVREEEWQLGASEKEIPEMPELPFKIPGVWSEEKHPRLARNIPPVVVEFNPGAIAVSQRQYYIPRKAQIGIQKHLERLLKYGIIWPCQSSQNTPYCLSKN
jgi:hypothetical protein